MPSQQADKDKAEQKTKAILHAAEKAEERTWTTYYENQTPENHAAWLATRETLDQAFIAWCQIAKR